MHDDIDLLAELPPQRDDEPSSLRQDILDELADHLSCAYRRELLLTADDLQAKLRVLDRFGNPLRIAYQLWFQAMWSRIMSQRLVLACSVLTAAASIAAALFVGSMFQQQQQMAAEQQRALMDALMSLTAKLQEQASAQANARNESAPVRDLVSLKFKLVTAEDPALPFVGASINITPEPAQAGEASPTETTDSEGVADFAYMRIGRYRYTISLPWGETTTAKFTVHPSAEHVETIAVPSRAPEDGTLQITSDMPQNLKDASIALAAYLMVQPRKVASAEWQMNGTMWAMPGAFPVTTPAIYVVQFPDGEVWSSPASSGAYLGGGGGMGGGGFGGMPTGGMGGGGGFFSIPAEAISNQLATTTLGQMGMGGGGFASPSTHPWMKTKKLTLMSGDYQILWTSYSAVDPSNMTEAQRMSACDLLVQSTSFSFPEAKSITIRPNQAASWTMTAPEAVINSILDVNESAVSTAIAPGAMAAGSGAPLPDPKKLRVRLTGPKEDHAFAREMTLLTESGRSQYPDTSWSWQDGIAYLNRDLPVGRYVLSIPLGDGQTGETRISIRDTEQPLITVQMPPVLQTFPIEIHGPIDPTPSRDYKLRPVITVTRKPTILDGTTWTFPDFKTTGIYTAPETGLVEELETRRSRTDRPRTQFTTEDRVEDRFLPLQNGDYELAWDFILLFPDPSKAGVMLSLPYPQWEEIKMPTETRTVDADHTKWDLKIPEELWAKLHDRARKLAGAKTPEPAPIPEPAAGSEAQAKVPLQIKVQPLEPNSGHAATRLTLINRDQPEHIFSSSLRITAGNTTDLLDFKQILPRRYQVLVEDNHKRGYVSWLDVSQPEANPVVLTYPGIRDASGWLYLQSQPLPQAYQEAGYVLTADWESLPVIIDSRTWWPNELSQISIMFDPRTGAPSIVDHSYTDPDRASKSRRSRFETDNVAEAQAAIPPDARSWMHLPVGFYRMTKMKLLRQQKRSGNGWLLDPTAEVSVKGPQDSKLAENSHHDSATLIEVTADSTHEQVLNLDPVLFSRAVQHSPLEFRAGLIRDYQTVFPRSPAASALSPRNAAEGTP